MPASRRDGVHRIAALLFLWGSVVIGGLVLAGFAATALVLFYLTVVSQW